MNRQQVVALLEVVDAKIKAKGSSALDSSDGGLLESIEESRLVDGLLAMFEEGEEEPAHVPPDLVYLRKRDLFYRGRWCGYTEEPAAAGRYPREEAERHVEEAEGVTIHELSEFPC